MKTKIPMKIGLIVIMTLTILLPPSASAQQFKELEITRRSKSEPEYVSNEVLVNFKEGAVPDQILEKVNIKAVQLKRIHSIEPVVQKYLKEEKLEKDKGGWFWFRGKDYKKKETVTDEEAFQQAYTQMSVEKRKLYRTYEITLPQEMSVEEAVAILEQDPQVEYAEPNYISELFFRPNDPYYTSGYQWAHAVTQAEQGWDDQRGNAQVLIAIIDSGLDYSHPDIALNIWQDGTQNDFVDINKASYEWRGYQFIPGEDYENLPGEIDNDPSDFDGHGTHCAGIAGAVTDNGEGVASVAHNCMIMPIRAGFVIENSNGEEVSILENDDIAAAIMYAAEKGASVISMSFGDNNPSNTVKDALRVAYSNGKGAILVAAAGNDNSESRFYPAAYNLEEDEFSVISVAATDRNDNRASYSNYGDWVDVAAPGGVAGGDNAILSTFPLINRFGIVSGYAYWYGTSMACPYVAGLAALIKSSRPRYTVLQTERGIYMGADNLGWAGRVNLNNSLDPQIILDITARVENAVHGDNNAYIITVNGWADAPNFGNYIIDFREKDSTGPWISDGLTLENGGNNPVLNGVLATWDTTLLSGLEYFIRIRVYNTPDAEYLEDQILVSISPKQDGWPQNTERASGTYLNSPVIADIDGDNDSEIIACDHEGRVYVWHHDGTLDPAWRWPLNLNHSIRNPAVGDLDGDGDVEIVITSTGGLRGASGEYAVFIYNHDGTRFLPDVWPKGSPEIRSVEDPACLVDLDKDGDLEIILGDSSRVYAWHHTGEYINDVYPIYIDFTAENLAVGDIDQDGEFEIVAVQGSSTAGGKVYAVNIDGTPVPGNWPVEVGGSGSVLGVSSLPVIGDINGDGQIEIIVSGGDGLFVLKGDGSIIWSHSDDGIYTNLGHGAPCLADLDNDGVPEIIFAGKRITNDINGDPLPSKIWVFKGDGTIFENWPYIFNFDIPAATYGAITVNLDEDVSQEVLALVYDEANSKVYLYIFEYDGTLIPGFPKSWDLDYRGLPALADTDNDGDVEMAVFGEGVVNVPFYLYDLPGYCENRQMDWPMYHGNAQHTGAYRPKGDVDGNLVITMADAIEVGKYIVGVDNNWTDNRIYYGDVDNDGNITLKDAIIIARRAQNVR